MRQRHTAPVWRKTIYSFGLTAMVCLALAFASPALASVQTDSPYGANANGSSSVASSAATVSAGNSASTATVSTDAATASESEGSADVQTDESAVSQQSASSESESTETQALVPESMLYEVDLNQPVHGKTSVDVSLPNISALISAGKVDSVVVEATMTYGGTVTRDVKVTKNLSDISSGSFSMDFADFGKWAVSTGFYKSGKLVGSSSSQTFGVVADEYNIAPLIATMPVTIFSLNYATYSKASDGSTIPTILALQRAQAINWNSLLDGMYATPSQTTSSVETGYSYELFAEYVRDLYETNPQAKFNFFLNDYHAGEVFRNVYANGIPDSQSEIYFLSDGSASYSACFNDIYGGTDPQSTHDSLVEQWKTLKKQAQAGTIDHKWYDQGACQLVYAALTTESNVHWVVPNSRNFTSGDTGAAFATTAKSKVDAVNIGTLFKNLKAQGETATAQFKAFFNFGSDYFAEAEQAGKGIMVVLGTRVTSEEHFSEYASFTKLAYGDDYVYYYKGHPATPTDLYPDKQAQLKELGLTDVDSSVAAELILFFYPQVRMSGYPSTTFESATADNCCSVYGLTKDQALVSGGYGTTYQYMKSFISPISDTTDAKIKALCSNTDSYLVEFSDSVLADAKYDIAIWDYPADTIRYYKLENDVYTLVDQKSGKSSASLSDGTYTITSESNLSMVLDIPGGSSNNGANLQTYAGTGLNNQQFKVEKGSDGYYTITATCSNQALDVVASGTALGTNVTQWPSTGADNQKWLIEDAGDGWYRIVSKCNGLYLDVQGGTAGNTVNVQTWALTSNNDGKGQLFRFDKSVDNGFYVIKSQDNQNQVLDVVAGSVLNGANVTTYERTGANNQIFQIYHMYGNTYKIAARHSWMALDVTAGGQMNGANITQWAQYDTANQAWYIITQSDGSVMIQSSANSRYVDIQGGHASNGANVWTWEATSNNDGKGQRFVLERAS